MLEASYFSNSTAVSLHNHSVFSDGASTLEEMAAAGKNAGLKMLGISDHWVVPPYEGTDRDEWAMAVDRLDEYVESLLKLKKQYESDSFSLKIGLEVDFFFENIDSVIAHLRQYPLDYLIGSVHYTGIFSVDHAAADWQDLDAERKNEICESYYRKVAGAAECGYFTFLGHLVLPKKFNMIDNSKYFDHAVRVLDILSEKSGAIELNTSGWFKACGEPYPAGDILQGALQRNIPIVISSDAHCKQHIQRNFNEASWLLEGLKNSI